VQIPEPAICLLCGDVVCGGLRHIDPKNPPIKASLHEFKCHADACGAGTGLFLILKLCSIVVIRGRRVTDWGSVYLDDHGEEDVGLKRGKPLYLNQARCRQLLQLFLSQAIDHNTRILDRTSIIPDRPAEIHAYIP